MENAFDWLTQTRRDFCSKIFANARFGPNILGQNPKILSKHIARILGNFNHFRQPQFSQFIRPSISQFIRQSHNSFNSSTIIHWQLIAPSEREQSPKCIGLLICLDNLDVCIRQCQRICLDNLDVTDNI